ncbi:MAG: DUF3108 domain-containing protein [Aestuariibacter sp.]
MRIIVCCVLALFCSFPYAKQLTPFEAKYDAYRNGSKLGYAVMQLSKTDNNQYKLYYKSDVSIFFLSDKREETSIFKLSDEGRLLPWQYHYKRTGTGRDKSLSLTFNEKTNEITINKKSTINWNGEWDNQLYRFDLQSQLRQKAEDIQYDLINYRGQKKQYGFEVISEEMLQLPYGQINAIKVKTIRSNTKRLTYSWFAPDLDYLLVRLQQFKKGDEQGDIQLSSLTVSSE